MELEKLKDLQGSLAVDRQEFGKMMILVSVTLLLVSIHSYTALEEARAEVADANSQLSRAEAILESDSFQQSLKAVKSIGGYNSGQQFQQAVSAMENVGSAINSTEEAEQVLEQRKKTYQWYSLIGILGAVAGVAVIYS
ncbi:MAG: hypothetical protein ABEJ98_02275 [Candidatus Nanohaloarchaea archaeon]